MDLAFFVKKITDLIKNKEFIKRADEEDAAV